MPSHQEDTINLDRPEALGTWGDFKLLRLLGRGGSGEVYLAHDPNLDRDVALKLGRPDRTMIEERLKTATEEARILASLRHPNIVTVFGAGCHDSRIGFWMDHIDGSDYAAFVKAQGSLSAEEAIRVGMDVCRALSQVHGQGLLHRDIKAHNVFREKGGRTVLMDFGTMAFQKKCEEEGKENISGTPQYMPPEILDGAEATPAYDIYSLGVLLFYLLSGELPVPGESVSEVMTSIQAGERRRLRDLRGDLDIALVALVEKASARNASDRFQTVAEMEEALSAVLQNSKALPPMSRAANKEGGKKLWPWVAGAAALALLAVAIVQIVPIGGGPLEVSSNFLRKNSVGSSYTTIRDGDELNLGDALRIEVQSPEDIFLYVINQDDAGNTFLLFPTPRWQITNPLRAGARAMLPGATVSGRMAAGWEVNSVGGNENFLLVATRHRLEDFEKQLASIPEAGNTTEGKLALQLGPEQVDGLTRGVGGIAYGRESSNQLNAIASLVGAQAEVSSRNDDVWVGWISFRNSQ